ncbi:hypothetical protein ACFWA6_23785 [Streptomyces sp. NPDC060020]
MSAARHLAPGFLDSLGNPSTVRNYGIGVGKTGGRSEEILGVN